MYSRVAQGELTREIRILNTVGIAGAIFTAKTGEIIHDVYADERFNKEVDQETGYKTKNMICSPVKTVDGKIIGVIQVLNKKKGRFTKENLNFVDAIATQAAVSIQNAQNSEFFEKKRAQEMEFVSMEINPPDTLLSNITGTVLLLIFLGYNLDTALSPAIVPIVWGLSKSAK